MRNLAPFIAFIFLTGFLSCSKEKSNCSACKVADPTSQSHVKFDKHSISVDVYQNAARNGLSYSLAISNEHLNSDILTDLTNYLALDKVIGQNEIVNAVLYLNESISDPILLNPKNIDGILVYIKERNQLTTRMMVADGSDYVINELLSKPVPYISSNDYYSVATTLYSGTNTTLSAISLIDYEAIPSKNSTGIDLTTLIDQKLVKKGTMDKIGGGGSCGSPCADEGGRCVAQEPGGNPGHEKWFCSCVGESVKGVVQNNGYDYTVDHNQLYDFRDHYLENSTKGQQYINWYYQIGTYINQSDISLDLALEAVNLAVNDVSPMITTLMTTPNSGNVLYNDETANNLADFANEVRELDTAQHFHNIMDDIISDLNYYKNKSVSEVHEAFSD